MLVHGLEVERNLVFKKLLDIVYCRNSIIELRNFAVKKLSEYKENKSFINYFKIRFLLYKKLKEVKYFQAKIVGILTNAKQPSRYLKYIPEFLINAGLKGKALHSDDVEPDLEKSVMDIAVYIAARLNKTPKEIIDNITPDETPAIISEIQKKEIADTMNLVSSHHSDPVKFYKSLKDQFTEASNKRKYALEKSFNKNIKDKRKSKVIPMNFSKFGKMLSQ